MSNETVYKAVTDRMIRLLESGVVPWRMTWSAGSGSALGSHRNAASGHVYRGINAVMTFARAIEAGYDQPLWLTFKQALAMGGNVRKGEKGIPIIYASRFTATETNRETGEALEREVPFLRYSTVFNVAQCDGITVEASSSFEPVRFAFSVIERCEDVAASMPNRPVISHSATCATPAYLPKSDVVVMPERERFEAPEFYYAALFHELTHSTAHASRLDRKGTGCRGSYGREELIAEMGAVFLCAVAGIEQATERDLGRVPRELARRAARRLSDAHLRRGARSESGGLHPRNRGHGRGQKGGVMVTVRTRGRARRRRWARKYPRIWRLRNRRLWSDRIASELRWEIRNEAGCERLARAR